MTRVLVALALLALPSSGAEPVWTHDLDIGGRAFVADRALLIAADVVQRTRPRPGAPRPDLGAWASSSLQDPTKERTPFRGLTRRDDHYAAPNGMELGVDSVDFLAERVGAKALAFGFRGSCQPVTVLARGRPIGLLMPRNTPGSAVEAPPRPQWVAVARLPDGTRYLLDSSFVFSEVQLGGLPMQNAGLTELSAPDVERVSAWLGSRVKAPFRLSDLRCGAAAGTYEGPGGVLLNARYVDTLRARLDLSRLELHAGGPLEPIALVLGGRGVGVLMPMKP